MHAQLLWQPGMEELGADVLSMHHNCGYAVHGMLSCAVLLLW